jgi:purine nucleoside phosphorylase
MMGILAALCATAGETGMNKVAILTDTPQTGQTHDTAYGASAPIAQGEYLLCAPTFADPRATARALKDLGATHLWLMESVGALSPLLETGDWIVPDDYIDGTRGQHYTFFSEKAGGYVQQVPPFDPASREAMLRALADVTPRPFKRGVYICVSNTRLETPAEALFWMRAGGHVVGRYLSPYLTLARELEIQVAVLARVCRSGGEVGESFQFDHYAAFLGHIIANLP